MTDTDDIDNLPLPPATNICGCPNCEGDEQWCSTCGVDIRDYDIDGVTAELIPIPKIPVCGS